MDDSEYTVTMAATNTFTGRTRIQAMCDPAGSKLAEITTKRGAQEIARRLNQVRTPTP